MATRCNELHNKNTTEHYHSTSLSSVNSDYPKNLSDRRCFPLKAKRVNDAISLRKPGLAVVHKVSFMCDALSPGTT